MSLTMAPTVLITKVCICKQNEKNALWWGRQGRYVTLCVVS